MATMVASLGQVYSQIMTKSSELYKSSAYFTEDHNCISEFVVETKRQVFDHCTLLCAAYCMVSPVAFLKACASCTISAHVYHKQASLSQKHQSTLARILRTLHIGYIACLCEMLLDAMCIPGVWLES